MPVLAARALLAAALLAGCGPAGPSADAPPADGDPVAARRLRLLTVAEYRNTVRDLFPALAPAACTETPDCNVAAQSCVDRVCEPDDCATHTFILPAAAPLGDEVVVAGSFNNWSGTAAAGGLRMTWSARTGQYYAKTALSDATWAYKFVIDGATWIVDPANPQTTPDGFGGNNSVVVQACAGAASDDGGFDPAAGFLPDTRPEGFPFDTAAEAGLVNSARAQQYLDAGAAIAARALRDPTAALGCDPNDDACVRGWLSTLGEAAWRRPLVPAEVDGLFALVGDGETRAAGLSAALQAMLSSPHFLYRTELGLADGSGWRLTPWETASAMSYFLWSAPPDPALRAAAASGALDTADGRAAAAARMLDDPRARPAWRRFITQWLGLEPLLTADRSPALYPQDSPALRAAMVDETASFAEAVLFDRDGTVADLLAAPWTVAGPEVRALYGLPSGAGEVDLPAGRAGVLGHAAFLAAWSHSDQSSPFRRGVAIRTRVLCETFDTPPPSAGGVPDVDPNATTRERFEQHSASPACSGCHKYIDPVGMGLETFDALGAARSTENGRTIDPTGDMVDVEGQGTNTSHPYASQPELAAAIAEAEAARRCLATQVARQATGVALAPDDPRLDGLIDRFNAAGGNLRALLLDLAAGDLLVRRSDP
jgi:hypothetical protein